jgi:tail protein
MQLQTAALNGSQIHSNTSDNGIMLFQSSSGLEFPDINRFSPYAKPGESGSVVPNSFYDGRSINLMGRVSGANPTIYSQNKRKLFGLLAIIQNSLNIATPILFTFTTMDGLQLQCYVWASQSPKYDEKSLVYGTFQIQLYAQDFNLYSQSVQTVTVNLSGNGGLVFPAIAPFSFPANSGGNVVISNNGNSNTWPLVTFYGPLTSPYVKNLTIGDQFIINYTLLTGDVLAVDMINKTMLLNGNNAMQYFDYLNQWMSLQPITFGTNTINFGSGLSADSGHVDFSWQDAYLTAG